MVSPDIWDLDRPVLMLPEGESLSLRDFYEGTLILGSPGSGKTSSSYFTIVLSLLRNAQAGGIFFCAKPGDGEMYLEWCRHAGRIRDVIHVTPTGRHKFDIFRYLELTDSSGDVENIVALLTQLLDVMERNEGGGSDGDPFWQRATKQSVRMSVSTLKMAGQPVSIQSLEEMVLSAAKSPQEIHTTNFKQNSFNYRCLKMATERCDAGLGDGKELDRVGRYFMRQWPSIPDKTRGSIEEMVTGMTSIFLSKGVLRDLFASGEVTFCPEMCERGALVIVDLPSLEEYVYMLAQILLKAVWQKALLRRLKDRSNTPRRPVLLAMDEAQALYTDDHKFLQVARGAQCVTLMASQNQPGFVSAGGGDMAARAQVDNFWGNVGVFISHSQRDSQTREFLAGLIGRGLQWRDGISSGETGVGENFNLNSNQQMDFLVQPNDLARLRRGGPENNYECDSYLIANKFATDQKPWRKVAWSQRPHLL